MAQAACPVAKVTRHLAVFSIASGDLETVRPAGRDNRGNRGNRDWTVDGGAFCSSSQIRLNSRVASLPSGRKVAREARAVPAGMEVSVGLADRGAQRLDYARVEEHRDRKGHPGQGGRAARRDARDPPEASGIVCDLRTGMVGECR